MGISGASVKCFVENINNIFNSKIIFGSMWNHYQTFSGLYEKILSLNYSKRYYFDIPAPIIKNELLHELDKKWIWLININNSLLKKEVLSRDSYLLDIDTLTSTKDGENNNLYMCDKTHLSPKCLSILFKTHLYKPESVIR